MNARRAGTAKKLLIKVMVCAIGALSINMTRMSGDGLPPLLGLALGGGIIQLYPCMGWMLFSSFPLACYAIEMHVSVSALGYAMLMRHGSYFAWRMRSYGRSALLCAAYVGVTLVSQLIMDARYATIEGMLPAGLISAALFFITEAMLCAVFQWLYLQTARSEAVIVIMLLLNALGIAAGYTLPGAAVFIPISWAMFARSGLYSGGGYCTLAIVALELAATCVVMLTRPRLQVSIFMPRNHEK